MLSSSLVRRIELLPTSLTRHVAAAPLCHRRAAERTAARLQSSLISRTHVMYMCSGVSVTGHELGERIVLGKPTH